MCSSRVGTGVLIKNGERFFNFIARVRKIMIVHYRNKNVHVKLHH